MPAPHCPAWTAPSSQGSCRGGSGACPARSSSSCRPTMGTSGWSARSADGSSPTGMPACSERCGGSPGAWGCERGLRAHGSRALRALLGLTRAGGRDQPPADRRGRRAAARRAGAGAAAPRACRRAAVGTGARAAGAAAGPSRLTRWSSTSACPTPTAATSARRCAPRGAGAGPVPDRARRAHRPARRVPRRRRRLRDQAVRPRGAARAAARAAAPRAGRARRREAGAACGSTRPRTRRRARRRPASR